MRKGDRVRLLGKTGTVVGIKPTAFGEQVTILTREGVTFSRLPGGLEVVPDKHFGALKRMWRRFCWWSTRGGTANFWEQFLKGLANGAVIGVLIVIVLRIIGWICG